MQRIGYANKMRCQIMLTTSIPTMRTAPFVQRGVLGCYKGNSDSKILNGRCEDRDCEHKINRIGSIFTLFQICDMIKGDESDVANIDFEL